MPGYRLSKSELEFIVNDIGQELLPLFPKEELLKQLTVEDIFASLTAGELRKILKVLEEQEKRNASS